MVHSFSHITLTAHTHCTHTGTQKHTGRRTETYMMILAPSMSGTGKRWSGDFFTVAGDFARAPGSGDFLTAAGDLARARDEVLVLATSAGDLAHAPGSEDFWTAAGDFARARDEVLVLETSAGEFAGGIARPGQIYYVSM